MSSPRKCDANNCLPASRGKSHHPFAPSKQADRASPSVIKPARPWAGSLTFFEDFTLEHSLPGLRITSIAILGGF